MLKEAIESEQRRTVGKLGERVGAVVIEQATELCIVICSDKKWMREQLGYSKVVGRL
jgi:hypothetical protein